MKRRLRKIWSRVDILSPENGYKLKTLPSLAGKKIIRVEPVVMSDEKSAVRHQPWTPEVFREAKMEFDKLRKDYGVNVVQVDEVIGKNEYGRVKMFLIVDDIEGVRLDEVHETPSFSDKTVAETDSFLTGVLSYLFDAYRSKKLFLSDLGELNQYVYGHKAGESQDKIYLVDVEPYLSKPEDEYYRNNFQHNLLNFFTMLGRFERRLLPTADLSLPKLRAKLEEAEKYLEKEKVVAG